MSRPRVLLDGDGARLLGDHDVVLEERRRVLGDRVERATQVKHTEIGDAYVSAGQRLARKVLAPRQTRRLGWIMRQAETCGDAAAQLNRRIIGCDDAGKGSRPTGIEQQPDSAGILQIDMQAGGDLAHQRMTPFRGHQHVNPDAARSRDIGSRAIAVRG